MKKLVQNGVMDGQFVKNIVMDAKIDPKIVIDLSMFKIGGGNSLQPSSQNLLEEFIDKNEPWLLIRIPSQRFLLCDTVLGNDTLRVRIST